MKSDSLQTPQIDVELRNVVEILQKGGRITRSKRNPAGRPPETHPRERTRALLRAAAEPTLAHYLARHNLNPRDVLPHQYLPNKRLRRLNKQYLPEHCFLFEKNYHGYRLKHVRLLPKKARASEFLIEETAHHAAREPTPARPALTRSLNAHDDAGFLAAVQTLVLVALNFEEFQTIFQHILAELRKNYQRLKIEELSRLSEDRPSQRSLPPDEPHPALPEPILPEPPSPRPQQADHDWPEREEPKEEPREQSHQQSSVEIYELITKEIGQLDRAIFQKLAVGKLGITLWPAVVLQPLIGQLEALADQAPRISDSLRDEYRSHRPELRSVEKLLQVAFEQVLQDSCFQAMDKSDSLQSRQYTELAQLVEQTLTEVSKQQSDRIVVQLIGTLQTRALTKGFLRWQQFNHEQIETLLFRSPYRALIDDINLHIEALNKFAAQQNATTDNKNCFFRLSRLENNNGEVELCIPIRMEQGREDKRLLVRLLREGAVGDDGAEWLKWVEPTQVTVNLTLPKHSESQKKFYYLLGSYVSVEQGLALIYGDFHYRPASFSKVLRRCYPQNELRRTSVRDERCIYCYYKIDKIPHFRCKFCLRFTHQECSPSGKALADSDTNPPYPADIYETDNDEQVWHCEECAPCNQCQLAVRANFLRCSCGSQFHNICGRLKANELGQGQKYTCQGCLKCRICSNKLKNQQYFVEQKMTFCLKCFKDYQKDEYCIVCMRQQPGKWVQCDKSECSKWVHVNCDNYFKEKENKETLERANYSCPVCRLKERRKITKWVIEEIRCYDEYQYFYEPEYEEIIGYKEAIAESMCLFLMREKAVEGKYDADPFRLISADLELLVRNAMTFNMPKDEAHYRAKVLLVVGSHFLERVRDLLQCNEEYLVNEDLQAIFAARKKQFRVDLYEHLLEYLLNFRAERGQVEVKRISPLPMEHEFFSSKIILNRSFANAEFRFRIKKKPHRIENLFTIPRLNKAAWAAIRAPNCYFHPESNNPIIYYCPTCSESYCCTRICLNHRTCSCGTRGCGCDRYACGCPAMRDKQRRNLQGKIQSTLSQSKLERREYTEYYKYCLKCVVENLRTNWCYLCRNFCYSAYEKCRDCGKIYHSACERKYKMEEMAVFYEDKACYEEAYSNSRLPQLCCACCNSLKYARPLKQLLMAEIKSKSSKLHAINSYLPLFNYLYEKQGIRLTINETINLLYQNYSLLVEKEPFIQEMLENFNTAIEHLDNNKIARDEFRDYYVNQMGRKLQSQNQHEKYISFVETKEMKELKQSKKFFKIFSKRFTHLYFPVNFANAYEIKYHLEHLTAKMSHSPHHHPHHAHHAHQLPDSPIITTNFRDDAHLNLKNFERIKIEAITSYVSPKSKKNIYYTNRLEKLRNYLKFWDYYYDYKRAKIQRNRDKFEQAVAYEADPRLEEQKRTQYVREEHTREKVYKEYEKYLRFHADHENLTDCIYKQQSSKSLLSQGLHCDNFNPFNENCSLVRYNRLVDYIDYDHIYSSNKSEMLVKYLSNFALKIYEENKIVLKKGSTCILNDSVKSRRILKKFQGNSIEIRLEQKNENWWLQINENSIVVRSIDEIARKLREISPIIETFEDVAEFLGFAMGDSTFYEPNHFTHLLQTTPLDALNRKQRKREVLKAYDKYTWKRQGYFTCVVEENGVPKKYEYNVTKKELFYLKKRTANSEHEEELEPRVVPFITFEDIKKDLEDLNYIATTREKENFVIKEPNYDVYIAPSKIDRLGLFIRTFVKKNTIVAEYIGQVISEAIADMRQAKFHFGCYMFGLFGLAKNNTRQEIIDATFIGNMARYLNHSCDPNCKARIEMVNGHPRIFIYTVKDIKENEELTYDYQFKIDTIERLTCKCKAKNCQGRLT